jgi:hypothetical protein
MPEGLCQCGCGRPTKPADRNRPKAGWVKGEPRPFLKGHGRWVGHGPEFVVHPTTGCWLWERNKLPAGYGLLRRRNKGMLAHRVFYEDAYGPIPAGMVIDHLCRVPSCVNPAHLQAVSQAENVRRGSAARLTLAKALEARALVAQGHAYRDVARRFDVSTSCINEIVNGRNWRSPQEQSGTPNARPLTAA